jgi:hypothetical protein
MGSRLLLGAAAILAAFAFPAASQAADAGAAHAKKHHGYNHHRYCCDHVGGHRYWYQNKSFPFNDQNSAPGHYNNQDFWERVQTQRNYPLGY